MLKDAKIVTIKKRILSIKSNENYQVDYLASSE